MSRKFSPLNSLRGRYLMATLLLTTLMLVSAWFAQSYVQSASTTGSINVSERNKILILNRAIRYSLWDAENALNAYVLSPSGEQQKLFTRRINTAIDNSQQLASNTWLNIADQTDDSRQLILELLELRDEGLRLMQMRNSIDHLFPTMRILRDVMTPRHKEFYSAVSFAHDDLAAENFNPGSNLTYQKISSLRLYWTNMVSQFRGYVTLLTGTFGADNPDILQQQATVELLYEQVVMLLGELNDIDESELGFETSESLIIMNKAASEWHAAYEQVKKEYRTESWRSDAPFMRNNIYPLQLSIRQRLTNIDNAIENSSSADLSILTSASTTILRTFWLLIILSIAFIIAGYILLSRIILQPIAAVTEALGHESLRVADVSLPKGSTIETQQLVTAFDNMRNQVQSRQQALEHQALHDALTGLPNRSLLQDRLEQAIQAAQRDKHHCALLLMDLDRFKDINDTLGHQVGDSVLQQVSLRLTNLLRGYDTIARLGGDEFAVLLPAADTERAIQVAEKIITALDSVFMINGHSLYVSLSIGIALFPDHGDDSNTLVQRADVAMYIAKRGNTQYALYDNKEDPHSINRLTLVNDLRDAISNNNLQLYFQPKFNVKTGGLVGVEALIRWQHPTYGFISPHENISLAEQTGLIKPLTAWVVETALEKFKHWEDNNPDLTIAINLSAHNFQDDDIYKLIKLCLKKFNVPPHKFQLEITESAMMAEPIRAKKTLQQLGDLGVIISIDDFGTGFSSLSYLKQLPVDEIKIDKSFVIDMINDENDAIIVRSTINLAHNLGLQVVAEGVESQDILDILAILGCDTAQGNYLAEPMANKEFEDWLTDYSRKQAG